MDNTFEIEVTETGNDIRCEKCGADYGFSVCRHEHCPVRAAKGGDTLLLNAKGSGGPRIIVLGNEKGGSGKSTIAMHLIVALMRRGFRVGSIDLDSRQGTLTRYIDNRRTFAAKRKVALYCPEHRLITRCKADNRRVAERDESKRLREAMAELADQDYVVIDTPGTDSFISRAGHALADVLITPVNDSLLDLDLLARVNEDGKSIKALGEYGNAVAELRADQYHAGRKPMEWIVIRNRLSHIDARNKREISHLLEEISKRAKFGLSPGFGERVIFRELFLKGLTLLDLREQIPDFALSLSHVSARQEIRILLSAIGLTVDDESTQKSKPSNQYKADVEHERQGGNQDRLTFVRNMFGFRKKKESTVGAEYIQ